MTTVESPDAYEESEYDGGGVGDGHITKKKEYHTTTAFTGQEFHVSYRGDLRGIEPFYGSGATETAIGPFTVFDVNWAGERVANGVFDVNPTWTGSSGVLKNDGLSDYADSTETNRKALTTQSYDNLGRVYETEVWTIDSSNGQKGAKFLTENFYDRNDSLVAETTKNATFVEHAYDGAGRNYQTRIVADEIASTPYSSGSFVYRNPKPDPNVRDMDALTSGGGDDDILEIEHEELDDSGNVLEEHVFEANHDDGDGLDVTADDDYVRSSEFFWYDADSELLTTIADYGSGDTNSGSGSWDRFAIPARGAAPTSSSDQKLVTKFTYNTAGLLETITTPTGSSGETVQKIFYDDLERTVYVAENFDDFVATTEANTGGTDSSEDRVTRITYDGLGNIIEHAALDPDGNGTTSDAQLTTYLYEDSHSASLVTNIIYPDSSDTTSLGTDQVKLEWDLDGSLKRKTDQRGVVIEGTYNNRRQQEFQKVTDLGSGGVDGHVRAVKREYDSLARLEKITSYENSNGTGEIRNQVLLEHNDLGEVTRSWQSHQLGKTSSTPKIEYSYDLTSSSSVYNDGARLEYVQYPDGRKIHHGYSTSGSVADRMNRVATIHEDNGLGSAGTTILSYAYSGLGRLAEAGLEEPGVRLTYHQGDNDDAYEGLDRFGRPKDHFWDGDGATADVDRLKYSYDRAHSLTQREIDSSIYSTQDKDQVFEHDGLERLTSYERRVLVTGPIKHEQDFTLDQLGNWTDLVEKTNGSTVLNQDRDHNDANQLETITETTGPAWIDPVFDAAGNMTEGPKPGDETTKHRYVYDAWNRLVKVKDSAGTTTLATFEYDGLDRRIRVEDSASNDWDFYYNEDWQVLEIRKNSNANPLKQFVWHPYYEDALAVRFWDSDTNGSQTTHYYTHDANMNVTALLDDNGVVKERYEYTPYGVVSVLTATFGTRSSTLYDQEVLYTGQRREAISQLYHYRFREYHTALGRFLTRDPAGYLDGLNLYEYVAGNPLIRLDPYGLGFWGWVQGGLDVAGFIPGIGIAADLLNAGIDAAQGNWADAGLNVVAAVPGFGDGVKAAKIGVKVARRGGREAADAARRGVNRRGAAGGGNLRQTQKKKTAREKQRERKRKEEERKREEKKRECDILNAAYHAVCDNLSKCKPCLDCNEYDPIIAGIKECIRLREKWLNKGCCMTNRANCWRQHRQQIKQVKKRLKKCKKRKEAACR